MHNLIAIAVPAATAAIGLILGWTLGHRRGWTEARDLIVPRLDRLRARADDERVQRALLTSVRGDRA